MALWPPSLVADIVSPECAVQLPFHIKYVLKSTIPLIVVVFFVLVYSTLKRILTGAEMIIVKRQLGTVILLGFSQSYTSIVKRTLDVYRCSSDSVPVLVIDTNTACYTTDAWKTMVIGSTASLLVYVVGIPCATYYVLYGFKGLGGSRRRLWQIVARTPRQSEQHRMAASELGDLYNYCAFLVEPYCVHWYAMAPLANALLMTSVGLIRDPTTVASLQAAIIVVFMLVRAYYLPARCRHLDCAGNVCNELEPSLLCIQLKRRTWAVSTTVASSRPAGETARENAARRAKVVFNLADKQYLAQQLACLATLAIGVARSDADTGATVVLAIVMFGAFCALVASLFSQTTGSLSNQKPRKYRWTTTLTFWACGGCCGMHRRYLAVPSGQVPPGLLARASALQLPSGKRMNAPKAGLLSTFYTASARSANVLLLLFTAGVFSAMLSLVVDLGGQARSTALMFGSSCGVVCTAAWLIDGWKLKCGWHCQSRRRRGVCSAWSWRIGRGRVSGLLQLIGPLVGPRSVSLPCCTVSVFDRSVLTLACPARCALARDILRPSTTHALRRRHVLSQRQPRA